VPVFLGHYGASLAAKKFTPYTSLGTLTVASLWLDLLWPTFLLLGYERVAVDPGNTAVTPLAFEYYPWSHSLLMVLGWALVLGGLYAFFRRYPKGAWVVALVVVSHWLLDVVVHRPDLPLWPPAGPVVGLGLWRSLPATAVVEVILLGVGLWLYARSTEPTDAIGRHALTVFAVTLLLMYGLNLVAPPPPSATAVAWGAQAQWLLVLLAVWLDRHRVAVRQWR
jgi:hypothetical protein